MLYIWQYQ